MLLKSSDILEPMPKLAEVASHQPVGPSRHSSQRRTAGAKSRRRGGTVRWGGRSGIVATANAALLSLLLFGFCSVGGRSFVPPYPPAGGAFIAPAPSGSRSGAAARTGVACRLRTAGQDAGFHAGGVGGDGCWRSERATRRWRSCLEAIKRLGAEDGDETLKSKRVPAPKPEDEIRDDDFSDEAMRRLMFDIDPDAEAKGPMYFGDAGMYGEEVNHVKYPEEVRFPQCYLAFCLDRDEAEDEPKNFVTWGVRKQAHWEHLKWARIAKRTFDDDKDREAGILWDRSVLSPSKYRVIGNMFCIRAYTKEGVLRLLEEDPYRKAGLFGTVSLYRYPYDMGGEFNWHLSTFPYLALCMDKKGKGKAKIREENLDAHLKYYGKTRRCIGEGSLFDPNLAEGSPKSKPIGSLMFFNAINDEEAKETAEGDPFNEAGLYDSVFIARFNEVDLSGFGLGKANRIDPMRDIMAKEGLDRECEYPVNTGKYDVFANMKWLQTEVAKKQEQQYMEYRHKLYQQRDRRIERDEINQGVTFRPGVYVYMGKRSENEWYDYWPTKIGPDSSGVDEELFSLEASYPPVDPFEDDM